MDVRAEAQVNKKKLVQLIANVFGQIAFINFELGQRRAPRGIGTAGRELLAKLVDFCRDLRIGGASKFGTANLLVNQLLVNYTSQRGAAIGIGD